jgi:acyl-CoA thioesterase-1
MAEAAEWGRLMGISARLGTAVWRGLGRKYLGVRVLALLAAFMAFVSAHAQTPPADPAPPPLSKDCQTPGVNISGLNPLTNVQHALKDRKVIKILSIGASSSAGTNDVRGPYFGVIEAILEKTIPGVDVQIIDRGVSGELARDASERLTNEVALTEPDVVLWQLGTNDALARIPAEEFQATVSERLSWLREHNVDVALVGMPYARSIKKDPHYQHIRNVVRRTAEEHKVLYIGRYDAMQVIEQAQSAPGAAPPNEFALTEAGYTCLAEYVVRAVTSGIFAKNVNIKPRP